MVVQSLLEVSGSAKPLGTVSLLKGGREGREATCSDCRLPALCRQGAKCARRAESFKWVLMSKPQGVPGPQRRRRQWKEQRPTRRCLDLFVSAGVVLSWEVQRLSDSLWGEQGSREQGCSQLLLHLQHTQPRVKAPRAPATNTHETLQ